MRPHYEVMSGGRIALWRQLLRKADRPGWISRFLYAKWVPWL
jgi:hypothetical protein